MDNKKIDLFVTCLSDTFYSGGVSATANVLKKLGFNVSCPSKQTCCGQPMFNAGYFCQSKEVARYFLKVFDDADALIVARNFSIFPWSVLAY